MTLTTLTALDGAATLAALAALTTLAKVLCKPHFENPQLVTEPCETGSPKVLESAPIPNFKSKFMIGQLPDTDPSWIHF